MCTWLMINLQDANSPIMENLIFFHDHALMIILIITIMIMYILITIILNNYNNKLISQHQMLEVIWTIIPVIILIFLAIPSLKILYLTDESYNSFISIKTISHQWYWKYEYCNFFNIEFNSFMMQYAEVTSTFRLIDVDNRMIIPFNSKINILTTSMDVIHSWTMPSLGIKIDSIPGRINQTFFFMNRPGLYFGQCSEICGMNHSFMPIVIESTSKTKFIYWLSYSF